MAIPDEIHAHIVGVNEEGEKIVEIAAIVGVYVGTI